MKTSNDTDGWRTSTRMLAAATAACVVSLSLASCGSSEEPRSANGDVTITAGVFPIVNAAVAYNAADRGWPEDRQGDSRSSHYFVQHPAPSPSRGGSAR